MLAQFRISFEDIKIAILELNEAILDAETVEKMVPACPEPQEMLEINGYDGDLQLLGKAEQYVHFTVATRLFDLYYTVAQRTVPTRCTRACLCVSKTTMDCLSYTPGIS